MTEPVDPVPLLRALSDVQVAHVVIGDYAVIAYGVVSRTLDLAICPGPDPANLARLAAWLGETGAVQLGSG